MKLKKFWAITNQREISWNFRCWVWIKSEFNRKDQQIPSVPMIEFNDILKWQLLIWYREASKGASENGGSPLVFIRKCFVTNDSGRRQLKPATTAGRPKVASYWSKQRFTHTQAFNIHVTQRETESQRTGPLLNNSDSIVFK